MKISIILLAVISCGNIVAQYCTSTGPTATIDSNVESVLFIGENDTISHIGCPGVIGLQDLTSQNVTLSAGSTYSLNVKFGTCGGNYAGVGEVWIDYDQNGSFDPNESIGTWAGTPPVATSVFSVVVPVGAQNGVTRMRVMQREAGTLPINPCQTYSWGSAMDFNVTVTNGMDCSGYLGDNIAEAIVIGNLPYSDNRDNSLCYSNDNYVYPSPDVYYKLDPNPLMQSIKASLCGSSFDTFLSVTDAFGNVIGFNDDGSCGNQSEVTLNANGLGTIYFIVEGWGNEVGAYQLNIETTYVGLNETHFENVYLSPNPSNGEFTLNKSIGKLIIYNLNGQEIARFDSDLDRNIRLNSLKDGVYIVESVDGLFQQRINIIK